MLDDPSLANARVTVHEDGSISAVPLTAPFVEAPLELTAESNSTIDVSSTTPIVEEAVLTVTNEVVDVLPENITVPLVEESLNATVSLYNLGALKNKTKDLKEKAKKEGKKLAEQHKETVIGLARPVVEEQIAKNSDKIVDQVVQQATVQASGFLAKDATVILANTEVAQQSNNSFQILILIAFIIGCVAAYSFRRNLKRKNEQNDLNEYLLIKA